MATLLPAAGEPRDVSPAKGRSFTLEELLAAVGGYIEALYLADGRVAFCNEDGKRLRLPLNPRATALLRPRLRPDDVIVGDVIIVTRSEVSDDDDMEDGL